MINNDEHRYDDMLDLPYPYKSPRKKMSMLNRGAQFAPFAALSGHDQSIKETARLTDYKIPLSDEEQQLINQRLSIIQDHLPLNEEIIITYFIKDKKKDGGKYVDKNCLIRTIDEYEKKVIMQDHSYIIIDDIYYISGNFFEKFNENQ